MKKFLQVFVKFLKSPMKPLKSLNIGSYSAPQTREETKSELSDLCSWRTRQHTLHDADPAAVADEDRVREDDRLAVPREEGQSGPSRQLHRQGRGEFSLQYSSFVQQA